MKKNLLLLVCALFTLHLSAQVWTQQNTNFTNLSTAIGVDQMSVVDENTVWVRGFNGSGSGSVFKIFSRTNNGGTNWTAGNFTQLGATEMPYVMGARNYTDAYIVVMDTVSSATSFWGTTDGGTTWIKKTTMFAGGSSFANGVRFWDTLRGFCHGDPLAGIFEIYTTIDGGATWVANPNAPAPSPSTEYGYNGYDCMAVAPGGVGYIMTDHGRVLRTTDYGATWAATPNAPFVSAVYGSNKIYASSANHIICGVFTTATTSWAWMYTTDGGTVWNTYAPTGPFYSYDMTYVPGTTDMFVATSPDINTAAGVAYSYDGGMSWTDFTDPLLQPLGQNTQCLAVGFASQQTGWVGNYDQNGTINSILKYHDVTAGVNMLNTINNNDINIFPNPSNGLVNFSLNGPNNESAHINVYDVMGRMVFSTDLNVSSKAVVNYDFSAFGKGVYLVQIISGAELKTEKFIIK